VNAEHEHASCDSEAARLLPWFVTGRLQATEAARVDAHLATCAVCRRDLERQHALSNWIRGDARIESTSPQPSLEKLMSRIDATERATRSPARSTDAAATASRRRVPPWLVAAVVVQSIGLAALGSALWRHSDDAPAPQYRTLSSVPDSTSTVIPQIRVVFAPATTVRDVADVLRQVDARIVDGPSPAGAYSLALSRPRPTADFVASSVDRLRTDARIVFAEPIIGSAGPSP
jgi:hypothetical protein